MHPKLQRFVTLIRMSVTSRPNASTSIHTRYRHDALKTCAPHRRKGRGQRRAAWGKPRIYYGAGGYPRRGVGGLGPEGRASGLGPVWNGADEAPSLLGNFEDDMAQQTRPALHLASPPGRSVRRVCPRDDGSQGFHDGG